MKTLVLLALFFTSLIWAQTVQDVICSNESCCERIQDPNPFTGEGYLQFNPSCTTAFAPDCLGITGCERCFNPQGSGPNTGNRPVCSRFTPLPPTSPTTGAGTTGTPTRSCTNQACCDRLSRPNVETGNGFWEFDPVCLEGGVGCVNRTGCRRCFDPHGTGPNEFGDPFCRRFMPCNSTQCCINLQNPNNRSGEGYYQFSSRCIPNGGLHCVENTGCELCFSVLGIGPNHGNRPPCDRFLPCHSDNCCALLQVPISTGEGFLQFSQSCTRASGGPFCAFTGSGCQNCFNPLGSGPNVRNLPTCNRFRT